MSDQTPRSAFNVLDDAHSRRQLQNVLANWKLTPATFAHRISRKTWIPAPHLMYISSKVAKAIAKGNARIIISAPPRHGKSELLSIHTPSWILERFPTKKIILAGYGAELATGFSRRVRDTFQDESNFDLLSSRIRSDASRVEAFLTEQGGGMYAVGLGGAITGRGAHVLLIDDYIKEIKEALSPTYRDYVWNWFVTTAFTRLEPGGSCIIIATRWHSDDLIGRILTNLADENWDYIEIPAIAESEDILGRVPGEALFPERYPLARLEELRRTLGTTFFQALYQQKPVDETQKITDGNWLKIIPNLPIHEYGKLKFARIWDMAGTDGGGDFTAGTLIAYSPFTGDTYICNVSRRQLSAGGLEKHIRQIAIIDGESTKVRIEREPGSAGKALVHHYKTSVLPEFDVDEILATKSKIVRAQPFIAAAEGGKVYLLEGMWNEAFVTEFDRFPSSINDDQMDTASAGYTFLSGKKVFSASWGRGKEATNYQSKMASKEHKLQEQGNATIGRMTFSTRSVTFGRKK